MRERERKREIRKRERQIDQSPEESCHAYNRTSSIL